MSRRTVIHNVILRWGLVDDYTDLQGLKTTIIGRDGLSEKVVDAIFDNDLLTAGGVYGIPEAGDPVEVTSLQIAHDHGVTEITVYNLGIMLFHTNDEIYPRVLRVRSAIERQTEERPQNGRKYQEISTSLPDPGKQDRAQKSQDSRQVYQISRPLERDFAPFTPHSPRCNGLVKLSSLQISDRKGRVRRTPP